MRINQFVALATGLSRRRADELIVNGQIKVNGVNAQVGQTLKISDEVIFSGKKLTASEKLMIVFNKPNGYVCSRKGQGNKTIYDILPPKFRKLKPVGRLDKDSSGLLLLTNDGALAQKLTHPKFAKQKIYEVSLNKPLALDHKISIERGVKVEDYISKLKLTGTGKIWRVEMSEGKNRQIRRTFAALGYEVTKLHRTSFGNYTLANLKTGDYKTIKQDFLN